MKVIAPSKAFSLKDIEDILNGCEINLVFLYIPHGKMRPRRQEANVVSVVRDSSNVYRHPNRRPCAVHTARMLPLPGWTNVGRC